jgi:transcriptional regulator with XRE-family HTH domain
VRSVLGARIRAIRNERDLSLQALAAAIGMSRGSLGELERGEVLNPPLGTILRLMAALNVRSIELFFGDFDFASGRLAQLVGPPMSGASSAGVPPPASA